MPGPGILGGLIGANILCTETGTHPDLEFDPLVVPEHGLHFEVDADRGHERGRETVVGVPEQERSLADATVADDQQLEHVVEVLVGALLLPFAVLAGHLCASRARSTGRARLRARRSVRVQHDAQRGPCDVVAVNRFFLHTVNAVIIRARCVKFARWSHTHARASSVAPVAVLTY